jgi:hypothetical protein
LQTPYNVVVHITAIERMGVAKNDPPVAFFPPTEESL